MAITRFAPSPTGLLHLGHVFAASRAREAAGATGSMLLRIEDIDATRCRPVFEQAIYVDLAWLGFDWPQPVRRQSDHLADYAAALERLTADGLIYPCFCTRADLTAIDAPHGGLPAYPGTCRRRMSEERRDLIASGRSYALRLDAGQALSRTGPLVWRDLDRGIHEVTRAAIDDVVLARKDVRVSYHLAVTWDDALQQIDIVTRGEDLLASTPIHRLLQALLGLPVPVWRHHRLLLDASGRRFAKRDRSATISALRDGGARPADVLARVSP